MKNLRFDEKNCWFNEFLVNSECVSKVREIDDFFRQIKGFLFLIDYDESKSIFGTGFVTHLTTQINCERFYMQADMGFTKIHKPTKKFRQIKYFVELF